MIASERTGIYALSYLDTDDFAAEKDALLWLKDKVENEQQWQKHLAIVILHMKGYP